MVTGPPKVSRAGNGGGVGHGGNLRGCEEKLTATLMLVGRRIFFFRRKKRTGGKWGDR